MGWDAGRMLLPQEHRVAWLGVPFSRFQAPGGQGSFKCLMAAYVCACACVCRCVHHTTQIHAHTLLTKLLLRGPSGRGAPAPCAPPCRCRSGFPDCFCLGFRSPGSEVARAVGVCPVPLLTGVCGTLGGIFLPHQGSLCGAPLFLHPPFLPGLGAKQGLPWARSSLPACDWCLVFKVLFLWTEGRACQPRGGPGPPPPPMHSELTSWVGPPLLGPGVQEPPPRPAVCAGRRDRR